MLLVVDIPTYPSKVYLIGGSAIGGTAAPFNIILSQQVSLTATDQLIFGEIEDFTEVPRLYASDDSDWYAEEARIRGGYNNTNVDLGVKAYLVEGRC